MRSFEDIQSSISFQKAFKAYLRTYVTPHKQQLIREVLSKRTRRFSLVLEDIYKPHNASAVLRTCDCFGIQDVHVIEKSKEYHINPYVTRGAAQWITLHKYFNQEGSSVQDCFGTLRKSGYKIFATSPEAESIPVQELDSSQKIAIVFGNEHEGVSEEVKRSCDGMVHIPMHGFSESFNISVAAAIFLYELTKGKSLESDPDYLLSEEEMDEIEYQWIRDIVKNVDAHEAKFMKSWGKDQV